VPHEEAEQLEHLKEVEAGLRHDREAERVA
jgi:hypothetical protein